MNFHHDINPSGCKIIALLENKKGACHERAF